MSDFPCITTTVLKVHKDEVWNIKWSHDGAYLASASKDKSAIIWRTGSPVDSGSSSPQDQWVIHHILPGHPYSVVCLAWSIDDTILLTSSEHFIKLWNTETGICIRTLEEHRETVTDMSWLPDGSGFISGSLDRKIIIWDLDGMRDAWDPTAIRITDLGLTPDSKHLVVVGMECLSNTAPSMDTIQSSGVQATLLAPPTVNAAPVTRLIVFDFATKQIESSARLEGEFTSMQITQDSQHVLINHSPNEVYLWDIHTGEIARKYSGQTQTRYVIRSCFGGIDGKLVVSGSEDGNVYIWHRDTGVLLEVLRGHDGVVNAVAWNPTNEHMFASCSDDHSIRIWEPAPSDTVAITYDETSASAPVR